MIKDMTAKVNEVKDARKAVEAVLDGIEELKAEGKEALVKMEHELQAKQEALTMAQDMGEAKLIKQQIDSLQEDIELQKAVTEAKVKGMTADIEDKAEAFFKSHKSASFLYNAVDNYMILNTNLSNLYTNMELMQGFSRALSGSFAGVKAILLDTGIVAQADQNRIYKGIHLGQRDKESELVNYEYKIRPYINQLRSSGIEIR